MNQTNQPKNEQPEREPVCMLIVDDEEDARLLLGRIFDQDYRVVAAGDGAQAQQILREQPVDVIVSDQRMPGMSGVELLAWTWKNYPETVRILTTAHDDLTAAIMAINQGRIHRYVTKPWDIDELRDVVQAEVSTQQLQRVNQWLQREIARTNVELREANEALQSANQMLETEISRSNYWRRYAEAILETLPVSLIALDDALAIRSLNKLPPQVCAAKDDLVGVALDEIDFPADTLQTLVEGARRVFLESAPHSLGMLRVQLAGGERIWTAELFPIRDPHGEALALLLIQDVTEAHFLRTALIQSEKMASIGHLAGGVAHEFNNLIGGILGFAQLADLTGNPDDYKKTVSVVLEVSQRAKKIINNLLTFSRRVDEQKEMIKVADLVDQVVTLVERRFAKQRVNIAQDIPEDLALEIEIGQLQQALLQLLMSAQQAMPHGGVVTISARLANDGAMLIEVDDNGEALSSDELKNVFEPFYSLRGSSSFFSGRTKGVGLAVVKSLVLTMGAQVEARASTRGGGCTFTITLPVATVVNAH